MLAVKKNIPQFESVTRSEVFGTIDKTKDDFAFITSGVTAGVVSTYKSLNRSRDYVNLIVDRFHLSCQVYNKFYNRKAFSFVSLEEQIREEALLVLVKCKPQIILSRCKEKERNSKYTIQDIKKLDSMFDEQFEKSRIKKKVCIDTSRGSVEDSFEQLIMGYNMFSDLGGILARFG